jgi:hypothetical protein
VRRSVEEVEYGDYLAAKTLSGSASRTDDRGDSAGLLRRTVDAYDANRHQELEPDNVSITIAVDHVTHVLLADGWHEVADTSFTVEPYEYATGSTNVSADTSVPTDRGGPNGSLPAAGFQFTEARTAAWMCGPLVSVLAVRQEYP